MTRLGTLATSLAFSVIFGALAGTASASGQKPAAPAATPDPTVGAPGPDCLELYQIDHTEILDDNTILFHMKGKKTYVSKLPYRCHGLKFEDGFAYTTSITKICGKVDIIKVLRRGNSCPLGAFYEYVKPEKDALKGKAATPPAATPATPDTAKPDMTRPEKY